MILFRRVGAGLARPYGLIRRTIYWVWSLQHRERDRLWLEMTQTRELMPLLMKQRNGYRWSVEDRGNIRRHLLMLMALSPYLLLFVLPGGLLALPILAWWLDRRRQKRDAAAERSSSE